MRKVAFQPQSKQKFLRKNIFAKSISYRDEDKMQVMDLESYYQLSVGIERVRLVYLGAIYTSMFLHF